MTATENRVETPVGTANVRSIFSRWGIPAIIIVSIIAVYVQSLSFDFVTYDDYDLVYHNEEFLSKPGNILTAFTSHAFIGKREASVYYRPILQTSFIIDYQMWKLNPLGYHLMNMLLHIATSLLIFYLLKKLLQDQLVAFFGSLLFAVHPVQTEAVAWIAGRNDVLLGLFVILMMLAYAHYREEPATRTRYFILSLAAFACGLFTKEPAAFYLLLIPVYDLCTNKNKLKELYSREYALHLLTFIIILASYLFIRHEIFGAVIGADKLYGSTPLSERILQVPSVIVEHVSLLLFPVNLSVIREPDFIIWFHSFWLVLAAMLVALYCLAVFISWRYDRMITFALLWLLIGLLPVLNVIPVAVPFLEHRLYVPMAGFVLLLSRLFVLLRSSKASAVLIPVALILVVAGGIGSFLRLPVWRDSETLWKDAIEKSPTTARSYFNLSGYYFDKHEYEKVIPVLEKYVSLEPLDNLGYSKLRQTYFLVGRYNDATLVCKKMIAFNPTNPNRYIEAAVLYERMNLPDSALAVYKQGLLADSNSYQLHFQVAQLNEQLGRFDDAELHYGKTIQLNRSYAPAYYSAGRLYATMGKQPDAIQMLETGISLARPNSDALSLLHNLYIATKQEQKYARLLEQLGLQ